jgi:hypothetical protein
MAILETDRWLYHLENTWSKQPHTHYHQPLKPLLVNDMQNLLEHQLSSVFLAVPFWFGVKRELEITIL